MPAAFTSLPQDVLVLVCFHLLVEDLLALMQTCRVMHGLGSSDYLWRKLLSNWDIPLDVPLNATLASLPSHLLRSAAVKSLKLDKRWRDPHLELRHAQRIISQNSSFVDGLRFLPGGRWLVTLQYEQAARTHVTLWSTGEASNVHSVFKVTIAGRVRFLHAHHHRELEKIMIGVAFARGSSEVIRVYDVSLQTDVSARHSVVFEATSNELDHWGQIAAMKINDNIMIVVFAPPPSSLQHDGRIVCVNLVSRAAAILESPDRSFAWSHLKIFRQCFVIVRHKVGHTTANISFYDLPSVVLDQRDCLPMSVSRWPETTVIQSRLIASTSWQSEDPMIFEFSDDIPTNTCSFTMIGLPIRAEEMDTDTANAGLYILRVSLDGSKIECIPAVVPCRSVPSSEEIRVSSSGKRAIWLNPDPDTHESTLMKFALGREGSESCISTLMPSFSGLPFNPRDIHSFVFDEISCKVAVGLPSGELYILD